MTRNAIHLSTVIWPVGGRYGLIEFASATSWNLNDIKDHATQSGGDTLIDLGGGKSIKLSGMSIASLHRIATR
jgi:hypothetical protein